MMCQSLFFGTKIRKEYFKMSSAFTCGACCLMSVGRVVLGLVFMWGELF